MILFDGTPAAVAVFTVEEAAIVLGVSVPTVKRRCASGALVATNVGRVWLIEPGSALELADG